MTVRDGFARSLATLAFLLAAFAGGRSLHAQQPVGGVAPGGAVRADSTPDTAGRSSDVRLSERPPAPLMDVPIQRGEYRLGAGDVVSVSVFGERSFVHTLTVTPEGTLVVPNVGVTSVLGLNLDEAQARVRALMLRYYRNVEVYLTLSEVRSFKVFVVGAVPQPGVQVASATTRVSELVTPTSDRGVARRNILLRHASGEEERVDLARFLQTGDLMANPAVREGDIVLVPEVDQTVQVHGRVAFPGTYEYRPGETLRDFLTVVTGLAGFPSNAADTVRLSRFVDRDRREVRALSLADATGAPGAAIVLQPFDALYVAELANFREQKSATIQGQVRRPGTYPIEPGVTTIRDLVTLAGGLAPEASLVEATLRRPPRDTVDRRLEELRAVPAEFLDPEELQILQIRSQGDESNVVIDFEELLERGVAAHDQPLQDGDVLTVPRRRDEIAVLGAVPQPGILQYVPGQDASYFISLAGGFSRRADRGEVTILRAKLGTRVEADDVRTLEAGDKIIVPFREQRTVLERIQSTNAIVTTVSGFVLTVLTLRQFLPDGWFD